MLEHYKSIDFELKNCIFEHIFIYSPPLLREISAIEK